LVWYSLRLAPGHRLRLAHGEQGDRGLCGRVRHWVLSRCWRAISRSGDWIFARLWA